MQTETTYLSDLARAWATGVEGPVPAPDGLDTDAFMRLFGRQPVLQTLVRCLDRSAFGADTMARLDQDVEVARRRTVMLLLELERVLPALTEIGCRPVVLKGASLALTVYDRPEDRWFVDLDLLVPPTQLASVYDALQRLGYGFSESAAAGELYDRYHFHRIMVSNQGVCLEVHWGVTLPGSVYIHDLEALEGAAVEIPLGVASFQAPGTVDQILHGVLQSIADGFGDLRRLLDLHLLDKRLTGVEQELLCKRARVANLSTGLWLHYMLREQILGVEIPDYIHLICGQEAARSHTLAQLGVAEACLSGRAARDRGYPHLMHWVCAPRHLRGQEVRRYIFPDLAGLVNSGMCRNGLPSVWKRSRLALSRSLMTGRLMGEWVRAAI